MNIIMFSIDILGKTILHILIHDLRLIKVAKYIACNKHITNVSLVIETIIETIFTNDFLLPRNKKNFCNRK